MADNRRNIIIALGAGAALIGAAIIYHLASSSGKEEGAAPTDIELDYSRIEEQVKKQNLMNVVRNGPRIDTGYFLRLLQFVGATTREELAEIKKDLTVKRRACYKKGDWDGYEEIVASVLLLEDSTAQKILS
jgi:hypothetical protein